MKRLSIALLLLVSSLLPGSANAAECHLAAGDHAFFVTLEDVDRAYDVHVPVGCDPARPLPLVFDFHGLGGTKEGHASFSGMKAKADEEGFVIVHAQGHTRSWNSGWCCSRFSSDGAHQLDDVAFVRHMVQAIQDLLPIDARAIYATGLSNGGAMSHWLACQATDLFAAVAPVSFPLGGPDRDTCHPSRSISVLHFHGFSDTVVPYDGVGAFPPVGESNALWAELNDCLVGPVRAPLNNASFCDTYSECSDGVEVTLCSVDGGHGLYSNNDDVDIPKLAWDFLSRFERVPEPGGPLLPLAAGATLLVLRRRAS